MPVSLREEAAQRAAASAFEHTDREADFCGTAEQFSSLRDRSTPISKSQDFSNVVSAARNEWQNHGTSATQALEERRNLSVNNPHHLVVRVATADQRKDLRSSDYTVYIISVAKGDQYWQVEHRYSDFDKLCLVCRQNKVEVGERFPQKHWAGRIGNWTPSKKWAPERHEDLVANRTIQLDSWLVHLVGKFNLGQLPQPCSQAVFEFLFQAGKLPCDRDNSLVDGTKWKWNNPISFTLGSAIRQATRTVKTMCQRGLNETDTSIPLDLLQRARGLVLMTVMKGGLVLSGRFGTGLLVASLANGWSAPVAVGTAGLGWGALIGGDVTHYLIVLTTDNAVEDFCSSSSVQLGAEMGIAVGPVGRGANSHVRSGDWTVHPAYAYAHSQGLFAGISLEGSVCRVRHDVNTTFYGTAVDPRDILKRPGPKAAEPLYCALNEALELRIRDGAFRPSAIFSSESREEPNRTVLLHSNMIQSTYSLHPSQDRTPPSSTNN